MKYAAVILLIIISFGCSPKKSAEENVSLGISEINAKNYDQAIIHFKNALKQNPNMANARLHLAKSYLHLGLLGSADKELDRALSLKVDPNLVIPLKMRTLVKPNTELTLINQYTINKNTQLEAYSIWGMNLILQGNYIKAIEVLRSALNHNLPDNPYHQLSKALLALFDDQLDLAIDLTKNTIAADTDFNDALLIHAYLLSLNEELERSAEQYELFLNTEKNYLANLNYLNVLIRSKKYKMAEKLVDTLLSNNKMDPNYNEFKSELEFKSKQFKQAIIYADKALQRNSNSYKANYIAGVSHYYLNALEQSYNHLSAIEEQLNSNHLSYKILLKVKFKLGYNTQATDSLDNNVDFSDENFELITASSWNLLQSKNIQKANKYINSLEKINTDDPNKLLQRGLLKIAVNDNNSIDDFTKSVAIDPSFSPAKIALYASYLQQEQYEKAFSVADTWIKEFPNEDGGYIAKGVIYHFQKELNKAKNMFEQALKVDSNSIGATFHLSTYDFIEKKYEQAFEKTTWIISKNIGHKLALNRLLTIPVSENLQEESISFLKTQIDKSNNKGNILPINLTLAKFYIREDQAKKAQALLANIQSLGAYNKKYLGLLGFVNLITKDYEASQEQYNKLIRLDDTNFEGYRGLMINYELQEKYQAALNVISIVENKLGYNDYVSIYKSELLTKNQQYIEAEQVLAQLTATDELLPAIMKAKSALYSKNKNYHKAVDVGLYWYTQTPSTETAYFYAKALLGSEQLNDASNVLTKHFNEYGEDDKLLRLNAEINLQAEPNKALEYYTQQVAKDPANYINLNNLASAALKTNNSDLALKTALQAYKISPNEPQINDTLALAYLKKGQYADAEPLLEFASKELPEDQQISLHYAETLINLNKMAKSKSILLKLDDTTEKSRLLAIINSG